MDDLGFGLQVAGLGLAIVFGVLALLWLLLTIAVRIDARRPSPPPPSSRVAIRALDGRNRLEPRLVAAISIAAMRHADQRRRLAAPVMRSYWPGSLLFASRWVAAGRMRQSRTWHRRGG